MFTYFEMILFSQTFLYLLKLWPMHLYNVKTVIDAVLPYLALDPENLLLLEAIVDLYKFDKRFDQALLYGLRLGSPGSRFLIIHIAYSLLCHSSKMNSLGSRQNLQLVLYSPKQYLPSSRV